MSQAQSTQGQRSQHARSVARGRHTDRNSPGPGWPPVPFGRRGEGKRLRRKHTVLLLPSAKKTAALRTAELVLGDDERMFSVYTKYIVHFFLFYKIK